MNLRDPHQVEDEVRTALQRDSRLIRPELIAVAADEIGTVVLRGAVGTPRQRRVAADDAEKIEGVFEVINHLHVHPPVGPPREDDELRAAAMQRLADDARLHADHIHVRVSDGSVTLSGYVRTPAQREHAVDDVADLDGVRDVDDQIEVR